MKKIRSLREKIWEEELFPGCNQKEMKTILAFFAQNKKGKGTFCLFCSQQQLKIKDVERL